MLSKNIVKQIRGRAIAMDWNMAFGGKSKGNRHLFRVAKIARFLAKKENADITICESGAWLHDIGLTVGNDNNPKKIRAIAEAFLSKLRISNNLQKKIADCVESHEGLVRPKILEASIVHDADVLDKMGPLGIIRHTWKITNLIDPNANANEIFVLIEKHLHWRKSKLQTPTAKQLSKLLEKQFEEFFADRNFAVIIIREIRALARKGIATERIAKIMQRKFKNNFTLALNDQLSCRFLNLFQKL